MELLGFSGQARKLLGQCSGRVFLQQLKKERIKKRIYADRETAALDLSDYIDGFYNAVRLHSYLGGISPNDFEVIHHRPKRPVH